jgi:hypothetical protein
MEGAAMIGWPKLPLPIASPGLYLHPAVLKGTVKFDNMLIDKNAHPTLPLVIREDLWCPMNRGYLVDGKGKVWVIQFGNDDVQGVKT